MKEGKIEGVENPKYMTEARRKELERGKEGLRGVDVDVNVGGEGHSRWFIIIITGATRPPPPPPPLSSTLR